MKRDKIVRWFLICKSRFIETEVSSSSVMVAYYLLLSLFPLALAVGNILPYLNISVERILPYLDIVVPQAVQPLLNPIITSLFTNTSGGLLSLSAVGLLWSAGRGISYLQKGMNKAYGVTPHSVFLIKRAFSMLMVLLLLVVLVAFVLVFGIGQTLLSRFSEMFEWAAALNRYLSNFKWPAMFIFLLLLLLLAYRAVPDVKLRLRDIWPGALFATGGLLLLTQLFTVYVRVTSTSLSSYGTLGAFFLLMFWLNFCCIILLLGAILNATLQEFRFGPVQAQSSRVDIWVEKKINMLTKKWFGDAEEMIRETLAPAAGAAESEEEPLASPEGAQARKSEEEKK